MEALSYFSYVCDYFLAISDLWNYQRVDNGLHMNVTVWITKAFLSSTSHIAYNTPHTSFAVLTLIVSQDTVQHVNSSVSETSVECTEADWLFEHVDFLHIITDLNWFCKCVLEDVNWCFSQWGPSYQFCVSFIACISSKNTSNQGFIYFLGRKCIHNANVRMTVVVYCLIVSLKCSCNSWTYCLTIHLVLNVKMWC